MQFYLFSLFLLFRFIDANTFSNLQISTKIPRWCCFVVVDKACFASFLFFTFVKCVRTFIVFLFSFHFCTSRFQRHDSKRMLFPMFFLASLTFGLINFSHQSFTTWRCFVWCAKWINNFELKNAKCHGSFFGRRCDSKKHVQTKLFYLNANWRNQVNVDERTVKWMQNRLRINCVIYHNCCIKS